MAKPNFFAIWFVGSSSGSVDDQGSRRLGFKPLLGAELFFSLSFKSVFLAGPTRTQGGAIQQNRNAALDEASLIEA